MSRQITFGVSSGVGLLTSLGQLYLPPYDECTVEFMRDLMCGKKRCFHNKDIKMVNVPVLPELTAKRIYEMVIGIDKFRSYLPDNTFKRALNKEYLFNVIHTLFTHLIGCELHR